MTRVVIDLVFMLVILTWIAYSYLFAGKLTTGEFFIALMVNYIGTRYLLFSNLQYALLVAEYEETDE